MINDFARIGIVFFREFLGRSVEEATRFNKFVYELVDGPVDLMAPAYDRYIRSIDDLLQASDAAANEFLPTVLEPQIDGCQIHREDRKPSLPTSSSARSTRRSSRSAED